MPEQKERKAINVLTIAASDPSGGAGIEADLKVFSAHRVFGMTALTALTVQNSRGVKQVHPVSPSVFREILAGLAQDRPLHAVKIGALGSAQIVAEVVSFLQEMPRLPVVLDPVFSPSLGATLLDEPGQLLLKERLLPLVSIVCPNLAEAEKLTGLSVHDVAQMMRAAQRLCQMGAQAALVTGGHLSGEVTDVLCYQGRVQNFTAPRIPGEYHGTGCALSSALAARLALGTDLETAVRRARDYLRKCILSALPGAGRMNILGFPPADE